MVYVFIQCVQFCCIINLSFPLGHHFVEFTQRFCPGAGDIQNNLHEPNIFAEVSLANLRINCTIKYPRPMKRFNQRSDYQTTSMFLGDAW